MAFEHEGRELVAFRHGESYVAYENVCPHLGGPVCLGKLARRVVASVTPDGDVVERFSETDFNLVCPWHGFEFDITTGVAIADERFRLRRVALRRAGEDVLVA